VALCAESDERLALLAADGDRGAFGTLVVRWERRLYRFVYVRLNSDHDSSEVVQETLMRAWRAMPRFKPSAKFSTWLFSIAHRETVNVVRRRQKDQKDSRRELPTHEAGELEEGGLLAEVWEIARDTLDSAVFEIVWLRYAEDMEPKQIAQVTGKSAVGVRVALHRARLRLADAIGVDSPQSGAKE
jgi:RNA polymerase sigma-70 factor (ECF subfamily)